MTGADLAASAAAVAGAGIAPAVPGGIQTAKARLQGRRGAGPLQPYRELRRLWRRSRVAPEGAGAPYAAAPVLVAASLGLALVIVPFAGRGLAGPLGDDAFLLLGLLVLARAAMAVSAWDTGGGFGLMGATRELTLAAPGEALLAVALLVAAVAAGDTGLGAMWSAAAGAAVWSEPAHWCGAIAMAVAVVLETGRIPFDNPDTHLELTMVHEGPVLEYAGRDLAYLEWAAAARQWIVLLVAAGLYLPHPAAGPGAPLALLAGVAALMGLLALGESAQARMRLLRAPLVLLAACGIGLVGVVAGAVS